LDAAYERLRVLNVFSIENAKILQENRGRLRRLVVRGGEYSRSMSLGGAVIVDAAPPGIRVRR
jgi:hypothetical protein